MPTCTNCGYVYAWTNATGFSGRTNRNRKVKSCPKCTRHFPTDIITSMVNDILQDLENPQEIMEENKNDARHQNRRNTKH